MVNSFFAYATEPSNWDSLAHARGRASDIPAQLHALSSADPVVRAGALTRLRADVLDQDSRFSATPAVIPHLLIALADERVSGKAELMACVADLVAPPYSVRADEKYIPRTRDQAMLMEACRRAAGAGIDVYLRLARDSRSWGTRLAANYLLGCFRSERMRIATPLAGRSILYPVGERAVETDSRVRAAITIACVRLLEGTAALEDFVREIYESDPSLLVRTVAAIELTTLELRREATLVDAAGTIDTLTSALEDRKVRRLYRDLPWGKEGLESDVRYIVRLAFASDNSGK